MSLICSSARICTGVVSRIFLGGEKTPNDFLIIAFTNVAPLFLSFGCDSSDIIYRLQQVAAFL